MSVDEGIPTCTLPPAISWRSLVARSISSWDNLQHPEDGEPESVDLAGRLEWAADILRSCDNLDTYLEKASSPGPMCWFFQTREAFLSQRVMNKWSRDRLDDYVLLPATTGAINHNDCFFMSHFWLSNTHPDPDGEYLRLFQNNLSPQEWSYIWADWTCTPQAPRSHVEEIYFARNLSAVSSLIRNCGFAYFYPPFEARLWILYEMAEFILSNPHTHPFFPDGQKYVDHIEEMTHHGVRETLSRHGYKCTNDLDKAFLFSWLELLVILRRLDMGVDNMRRVLENFTWMPSCEVMFFRMSGAVLIIERYKGYVRLGRETRESSKTWDFSETWEFTPCPAWMSNAANRLQGLVDSKSDMSDQE